MSGTRAKVTALMAALQLTAAAAPLSGVHAAVQGPGADTLFPAQAAGYVSDFASVVDPESSGQMSDLIERLRATTGAEIAVVTLRSIGNHDAADIALAIGRKWKVGSKAEVGDPRRNAGIVLLVVPRQNRQPGTGHIRIEVGQGLEGIIPDALTPRIRQDIMGPELSREAYGPALLEGVRFLASTIARAYGVSDSALTAYQPPSQGGKGSAPIGNLLPILFLIVFIVLASRAQSGRRRRRRVYWGGPWIGGGWGGGGGFGGGGGGFGGFGGGGGFSGGGGGGRF